MADGEVQPRDERQAPTATVRFRDSYTFFALILTFFYVIALVLTIVGFTEPSWLGFS
jgi:hypothetical protein